MLISNNKIIGTANNNDTTSDDVIKAAAIKIAITNIGCCLIKKLGVTNPSIDNNKMTIGISNTKPNPKIIVLMKETKDSIEIIGLIPDTAILTKNSNVVGKTIV